MQFTDATLRIIAEVQKAKAIELQEEIAPFLEVERQARGLPPGTVADLSTLSFVVEEVIEKDVIVEGDTKE